MTHYYLFGPHISHYYSDGDSIENNITRLMGYRDFEIIKFKNGWDNPSLLIEKVIGSGDYIEVSKEEYLAIDKAVVDHMNSLIGYEIFKTNKP